MNEEDDKYKEKWILLAARCEAIQKENSEIAKQVVRSRRNLNKARRLRMRLLQKLDELGDPWRQGQVKGISLKSQSSMPSSMTKSMGSSSNSSNSKKSAGSSPDLDPSLSINMNNVLSNSGNSGGITMSDAANSLVSTLTNLPMPMLPMPVSPTPSPFADHDILPSESLTSSM